MPYTTACFCWASDCSIEDPAGVDTGKSISRTDELNPGPLDCNRSGLPGSSRTTKSKSSPSAPAVRCPATCHARSGVTLPFTNIGTVTAASPTRTNDPRKVRFTMGAKKLGTTS